ncbi:MAG TPA: prolyl oligopeptidase family serine peptidase [Terriglobales bacterium]|nr:prolyl oligopeptidase family serine peptidase [Terriglobales bacterium]
MKVTACTRLTVAIFLMSLAALAQAPSLPQPPATAKHPVTDEYQGVKVSDDYRWLENWDDPEVKQWSAAQNARSREYLDHLPARPAIVQMLKQALSASSAAYYDLQFRGGTLFAMKYQPPQQQPMLVALPSADDPAGAKVVFDPNASNAKGSVAVDFYVPSQDGKYVAAALSENGSEDSSAHVFEVATGKELSDVVPRVNFATAGGSLEWKADSSGFYYTRYPQGSERPPEDANFYQQVYFHRLGADPRQDTYVIGKDFPRIAEIKLRASDDGQWLIAAVANGDGGEFAHYVMDPSGHWTQVTHFSDGIVSVQPGPDAALYMLSRNNAPRGQILRLPLAHLDLADAKVIVPQSSGSAADESGRASIEDIAPASGHIYVLDIVGGPSRIRVFDLQGHPLPAPPLPPVSAVYQMEPTRGGDVIFGVSTYLEPSAWYRYDAATGKSIRTALFRTSPIHFDDTEVVREFAISKDGTRVPVNIIRRRGTRLDGSNPTLLEGYGGYGVSMKPFFLGAFTRAWLDQGGVYVIANLRGGAEYGEEWHQAGRLTRKQNVFDDFIACAQHLIERKYTSPPHLAILGGSNGGLLMGAAFTQRPDLFRAVVSYVGIYDMLRVELDPNGAFNVTEFGTVKDPDQFKALYAYSPYHHVKDGMAYPAILFLTGENDHRVNPMQSRKMTARLQAATSSGHPTLLRTSSNAGHGIGTAVDEQIEEEADVLSFLFDQLGIKDAAPAK